MTTLLKIEWLKIKRYRTFWILAIFFIVLLPLFNYQVLKGMVKLGNNTINLLNQSYAFPQVWGNVGFWGSIFVMFLSILIIILTTNEYTFRTSRQNIIDGWQRLEFYHAKVYLVLAISIVCTLYVFITGLLFGISTSGSLDHMFSGLDKVFYFFVLTLNYLGLALLISVYIKRSGLSIGLFLLYCLVIENILKGILNWKFDTKYGDFLPLQSSDELLPFPLMQMAQNLIGAAKPSYMPLVLTSLAWCAVYYFIGRRLLLKSDW
jgi:ABC-2 type transport system permease protein